MGKTTLPIDVDCHVFLLFSFEKMKFDLLVLCVFVPVAGFILEQCQTFHGPGTLE